MKFSLSPWYPLPRSKKSTPATKKATKRPAKATKANNMPSVADLNSVVQSNTTKRDRALIGLASVTALGAVGAACGKNEACITAVEKTLRNPATIYKHHLQSWGVIIRLLYRQFKIPPSALVPTTIT